MKLLLWGITVIFSAGIGWVTYFFASCILASAFPDLSPMLFLEIVGPIGVMAAIAFGVIAGRLTSATIDTIG